ncbi:MAG TPA: bifunctional riboflavin kinase/FAD synthetase [Nitrospiria bacterium]
MEIIRDRDNRDRKAAGPVVAIGNFDGVHLGHQLILKHTVESAKAIGGTSVVLTFDPHPLSVLAPDRPLKFLMTFEERLHWIEAAGIQRVQCITFTPAFATLTPGEFIETVLHDDLGAKQVHVGVNFSFGVGRRGRLADLQEASGRYGFEVQAVDPFKVAGRPVSSSRIRECLTEGRVAEARGLLGRPYMLQGRVTPSARRGRRLGYPTANFTPPHDRVIPASGIYAVWAELSGGTGRMLEGACYIGTQPTLGTQPRMVETHLLEPQKNLYDRVIRVHFIDWIRAERTFDSAEALSAQIKDDILKARAALAGGPGGL